MSTLTPFTTVGARRKPCPGCDRVFCTCPRTSWALAATAQPAPTSATVQPGKGTRPPTSGGVHPPAPGWGGKRR
jgi:hypothetical protein